MALEVLFRPSEQLDHWLASGLGESPMLMALVLAAVLGLRHATDPDHVIAVTALVAGDRGDVRAGMRIGASWGVGHAAVLVLVGLPLIAFGAVLPAWLESGAEQLVGLVILAMALRLLWRCVRPAGDAPVTSAGAAVPGVPHRSQAGAAAIGALHGLAGTGAVVVLLIAALPTANEALLALAVFAPMSIASMAVCTAGFSWLVTRPALSRVVWTLIMPALGAFGAIFGLWYAGVL